MADKILRKYNVSASGTLFINDGEIFICIEDGAQDVNLATLLEDFNGRQVKFSCNYDEEYSPEETNVDTNTGEVL